MRKARIKADGVGIYHCLNRAIDKRHIFDERELEIMHGLMRRSESFSGVEIVTYALMPNHFHMMLKVTPQLDISEETIAKRIEILYGEGSGKKHLARWEGWRKIGEGWRADDEIQKFRCRMGDISEFMKTFKQRYTQSYNRRHDRKGTLWEERFKSILMESPPHSARKSAGVRAIMKVATYIDLNPVRAKLAKLPEDYRWSGYGEAVAGGRAARRGLAILYNSSEKDWKTFAKQYRLDLAGMGEEKIVSIEGEFKKRAGISAEDVARIVEEGGELPLSTVLRCRVRYFSDGLVLGSKAFVSEVLEKHAEKMGGVKKRMPQPLLHADWGDLCIAKRLRGPVIYMPRA